MINKKPNKIIIQGKPKYVKIGDEYDFFQLFIKIEQNFKNCFLFESLGEESNISRYHIVGFNPSQGAVRCIKFHRQGYETKQGG